MAHVDVWVLAVGTGTEPGAPRRAVLSPAELRRAHAYSDAAARTRFVETRTALRSILGDVLGVAPEAVPLRIGSTGRLLVGPDGGTTCRVSVAHTEGCGLVAVARTAAVGIDVEPAGRQVRTDTAERVCSPRERAALADRTGEEWTARFLRLWVRKEAVAKADGRGVAIGFADLDVSDTGPVRVPGSTDAIHVADLDLGAGHVGAVATSADPPAVVLHRWEG